MQSNGAPDGRYLPPSAAAAAAAAAGMDYAAMDAHVAAAAHPHSHLDPHSAHAAALHYGLPPGHPAAGHHPHPPPPHPHHPHQQPHDLQTLHGPVPLVNQSHHSTQAVNKRSADSAGLDMMSGAASDSDEDSMVDVKPAIGGGDGEGAPGGGVRGRGSSAGSKASAAEVAASKKTRGRVKIKMEFIDNKLRRYTTFSKRKTGIMKKAYELSTLTGTQVMLLVASETGHVYTFATRKLQPMITSEAGKTLIQTCLNSPDQPGAGGGSTGGSGADQRMSATGYEETELTYNVPEDISAAEQQQKVRQMMYAANNHYSGLC